MPEPAHLHRIIGEITGPNPGPTLILIGGLHGNEPAGPAALRQLMQIIETHQAELRGTVVAMLGNIGAIKTNQRYRSADLNRLWTPTNIALCRSNTFDPKHCVALHQQ